MSMHITVKSEVTCSAEQFDKYLDEVAALKGWVVKKATDRSMLRQVAVRNITSYATDASYFAMSDRLLAYPQSRSVSYDGDYAELKVFQQELLSGIQLCHIAEQLRTEGQAVDVNIDIDQNLVLRVENDSEELVAEVTL